MRRWGEWIGYAFYAAFSAVLFFLPRPAALDVGRILGRLAFRIDRRHRGIALNNLAVAFGRDKTALERERIARESFANVGRVACETIKFTHMSRDRMIGLVDVLGREHLEKALALGRGVLLFTAHFGNWEAVVGPVSQSGPFPVIARALDNRVIDRRLTSLRERMGGMVINKLGAGRRVLRALARNEIIGILIDQNVLRIQAVFVDFFGKPAATTPALAAFHLQTGAPILPMFCVPNGRRLRLSIGPPVVVPRSGRRTDDVLKITQVCTKMIEDEIRRAPELWLWVHRRWNSRPTEEITAP